MTNNAMALHIGKQMMSMLLFVLKWTQMMTYKNDELYNNFLINKVK